MFQNKKTTPSDSTNNFLKNNKSAAAENFPIHTMKKDLEEINDSGSKQEKSHEKDIPQKSIDEKKINEPQKINPFFAASEKKPVDLPTAPVEKPAEKPVNLPIKPAEKPADLPIAPIKKKEAPLTPVAPTESKKVDSNKVDVKVNKTTGGFKFVKISIGIIVILILAGGGYYFWTTGQLKNPFVKEPSPAPITEPVAEPVVVIDPEPISTSAFVTDKPNYLSINSTITDSVKIKEALDVYADEVLASEVTSPIEFSVVDENNNPLSFQDFAIKSGIKFSASLAQNLDETFSLFIYNDQNDARIGLAIDSKDVTKLKTLMTTEEIGLISELEAIFLASDFSIVANIFDSSIYKEVDIRYNNLDSERPLSVDYAILGNSLVIGTTKMTLRSIVDYMTVSETDVENDSLTENADINSPITQ